MLMLIQKQMQQKTSSGGMPDCDALERLRAGQSRRAAVCTMLSTGGRSIPGGEVRAGQGVGGRVDAETRCESWACRETRYYR